MCMETAICLLDNRHCHKEMERLKAMAHSGSHTVGHGPEHVLNCRVSKLMFVNQVNVCYKANAC